MTERPISFSDVVFTVSKNKWRMLVSGILTALVAYGLAKLLPLQYSSEGTLVIEAQTSINAPAGVINDVTTQVDLLKSQGLIRNVTRELGLVHSPDLTPAVRLPSPLERYAAALRSEVTGWWNAATGNAVDEHSAGEERVENYVQKHILVKTKENSSLITVQFAAGSPSMASAVTNAVMDAYLSTTAAARQAQSEKIDRWIAEQMARSRHDVEVSAQRVEQFVHAHALPQVQDSLTAAIQLSQDQKQLVLAREDLAQKRGVVPDGCARRIRLRRTRGTWVQDNSKPKGAQGDDERAVELAVVKRSKAPSYGIRACQLAGSN